MSVEKIKTTEVKIDNLRIEKFFDGEFIGSIKKEIGNVNFEHVCMYILDEDESKIKDRIMIGYETLDDQKKNKLSVGARNPETLEKLLGIVKNYLEK